MNDQKNAIILVRISTDRQFQQGETLGDQKIQCERFAQRQNWNIIETFEYVHSSTKVGVSYIDDICEYLKSHSNIDFLIIKSIDRFSRHGIIGYKELKKQIRKYGVKLIDTYQVIGEEINTLDHLGLKYSWSVINPSEQAELMEANRAEREVADILTRMIGAEISYRQKGYAVRNAPFGFVNEKIATKVDGIRVVRTPHPEEVKWIKKMFNLRVNTTLNDKQIVKRINRLGFKNRDRVRWGESSTGKKTPIGKIIGKPLGVKQLQRFIQQTEYAGVIHETWTKPKPVRTQYKGLVSIDTFNRANRGKVVILELPNNHLEVKLNVKEQVRSRHNPLFPFKNHVRCELCNKPLLASSPKGKSGKKFPTYHCDRNHKYWGVPRQKLHDQIYSFLESVKFDKDFLRLFKGVVLDTWKKKQKEAQQEAIDYGKNVIRLQGEQQAWLDKVPIVTGKIMMKKVEDEINKIELNIAQAKQQRDKREDEQVDIEETINLYIYFMEHPDKLIRNEPDPQQKGVLFGLLFEEIPTYENLVSGTPNLDGIFSLKEIKIGKKVDMVRPEGLEPPTLSSEAKCSNPLSYGRVCGSGGTRTHDILLKRQTL